MLLPSLDPVNDQTISNKPLANSTPEIAKKRDLDFIDSEDEFADDEAEIFNDLDEEALRKLPPGLRNTMQAMQNDKRKRMHRKTGIFPDGGLRIPEAFSSSGEAESVKSTTSGNAVDGPAADMMRHYFKEHESEDEEEPKRVLRVTNPDIQRSDSSDDGKAKKEIDKSKEDKSDNLENETTVTSSDETSLWLQVMYGADSSEEQATSQEENDDRHLYTHDAGFPDRFRADLEDDGMFRGAGPSAVTSSQQGTFADSYMDRLQARNRGELTPSTALGSNPVTAEDLAFIESINQKNKNAREAVEQAEKDKITKGNGALASTGNTNRNSDIVPMRQWKEDARLAGIPTSPDHHKHDLPFEGFPVNSQTSSTSDSKRSKASGHSIKDNIRRPFNALNKRAQEGVAYVKGVLHRDGKSDTHYHSFRPESRTRQHDDNRGGLKIGPSYKTKPSGRRNPAAPDKGPRTDLNVTYRGHVEDYTI